MSRCCKGICERYPRLTPNYKNGKKCCRHCGLFLVSTEPLCPCCRYPLACKGRANLTQLNRRAEKLRANHTSEVSNQLVIHVRRVIRRGVYFG
jgi:hypothetical protein